MNSSQLEVRKSIGPEAYADPHTYKREGSQIFSKTWQYVGHIERAHNPGDYFVTEVDGESLVIIRGDDGVLNGFYNVCAHRAARLLSGEGTARRITCPYHAWTYDRKGRLVGAPNSDSVPGFNVSDHCLSAIRVESLHGLIFVTLDNDSPSLRDTYPGLEEMLKSYAPSLPDLTFAHRTEATMATNWKVAVENFSECYHCAIVHKSFFDANADDGVNADSYRIEPRGNWHLHLADAFKTDREQDHADEFAVWWLWPNFAIQSHPGCVLNVRKWTPLAVDQTHVAVDWFYPPGAFTSADLEMVQHHAATVFAEDIPLVEAVQQGLTSRGYKPGPLMIDRDRTDRSEHAVAAIQDLWRDAMEMQS